MFLFVSRITQKPLDRFSQTLVKKWDVGHERTHWILVVIQTTLRKG